MKIKKIITTILGSIFLLGIILAITGKILCIDSPKDYRKQQDEILVPEIISEVWISDSRLYLCYRTATCVNVYDLNGNFLWAVSAPYMKNAGFSIDEDKLIIYSSEAFVYSSQNGEFITVTQTLPSPSESDQNPETAYPYRFGWYDVKSIDQSGKLSPLITRPAWYIIFNYYICFTVSAVAAISIGLMTLIEKALAWLKILNTGHLTHPKANKYLIYTQLTSAVNIIAAITNLFLCSFTLVAVVSLHFIIAGIIIYNLIENLSCTKYERVTFDFWEAIAITSFVLLFFSVAFCF